MQKNSDLKQSISQCWKVELHETVAVTHAQILGFGFDISQQNAHKHLSLVFNQQDKGESLRNQVRWNIHTPVKQ